MRRRLPSAVPIGTVIAEARELYVELGGARILDGVSLAVRTGEVLALVGPNGAGKSTLLGALCGDVALHGGSAHLDGEPLGHWSQVEMAMRRAVMLQQLTISFPFTVEQIVAMGRAPWAGTPFEDADDEAVLTAMTFADVVPFASRTFGSLSGGERARVSLARALAQRSQLLLLDEPTAALDLHHQEHVLQMARERAREGDAVVIVLHDLNLAAGYADLLTEVYRHQVEVWPHPTTGAPVILPNRVP